MIMIRVSINKQQQTNNLKHRHTKKNHPTIIQLSYSCYNYTANQAKVLPTYLLKIGPINYTKSIKLIICYPSLLSEKRCQDYIWVFLHQRAIHGILRGKVKILFWKRSWSDNTNSRVFPLRLRSEAAPTFMRNLPLSESLIRERMKRGVIDEQ